MTDSWESRARELLQAAVHRLDRYEGEADVECNEDIRAFLKEPCVDIPQDVARDAVEACQSLVSETSYIGPLGEFRTLYNSHRAMRLARSVVSRLKEIHFCPHVGCATLGPHEHVSGTAKGERHE